MTQHLESITIFQGCMKSYIVSKLGKATKQRLSATHLRDINFNNALKTSLIAHELWEWF